jgi:hypothetical protein
MRLNLLHLDDALLGQRRFRAAASAMGARELDLSELAPNIRLWATRGDMIELRARLAEHLRARDAGPLVTWMGSGDFHHVSGVLVALLAEAELAPLTIVQFDNHPDWVSSRNVSHCGSWAKQVLDERLAQRVVGIGMTSSDFSWPEFKRAGLGHIASGRMIMFPTAPAQSRVFGQYGHGPGHSQDGHRLVWKGIAAKFDQESAARVFAAIETPAIYITIDKDVLNKGAADTNWDQGRLELSDLVAWLKALNDRCRIIGIDVVGDRSETRFGGPLLPRILKRGEILIDQPWRRGRGLAGDAINEDTNLVILDAIRTMLC